MSKSETFEELEEDAFLNEALLHHKYWKLMAYTTKGIVYSEQDYRSEHAALQVWDDLKSKYNDEPLPVVFYDYRDTNRIFYFHEIIDVQAIPV